MVPREGVLGQSGLEGPHPSPSPARPLGRRRAGRQSRAALAQSCRQLGSLSGRTSASTDAAFHGRYHPVCFKFYKPQSFVLK